MKDTKTRRDPLIQGENSHGQSELRHMQIRDSIRHARKEILSPTERTGTVRFEDLFNLEDIQCLQDEFAAATGVASIITRPDGQPITRPSNFCRLCKDIIRSTDQGRTNCHASDALIGRPSPDGATIQQCMSGGLWDAGAAITAGGTHLANWLVGQVRDEEQSDAGIREYARKIGADEDAAAQAFHQVPAMSRTRFEQVARVLFTIARQLSATAWQNIRQAHFIADYKQAEKERQRLEKNFQILFLEMLEGFALQEIIRDSGGRVSDYRFLAVNPAFERMTGLKAGDIIGRTALEVLPDIEQHWIEDCGRVALTGTPAFFDRYSRALDRHFQITVFQPAPGQFACIYLDITERKRSEKELARVNADLAVKNAELEQVIYVASHDLRSPLVNIDGYSKELLYAINDLKRSLASIEDLSDILPEITPILKEDIPEAVRFIRTSAAKMDALLAGLLHLSRSGRAALIIEPVDMNRLVSQVVDSVEFQIREAGVTLDIQELPPCQGDAVQVTQVFSNLLDNALKYLDPQRPGHIRIMGRTGKGHLVDYSVEDNGIGIDKAYFDKIFDIFHRLDPSRGDGEGLGLTIVKRIAGRLGGSVRVESGTDSGARFVVTLPAAEI